MLKTANIFAQSNLKVSFPKQYVLEYGSIVNISIYFSTTECEAPWENEITVYLNFTCIKLGTDVEKVKAKVQVVPIFHGEEKNEYRAHLESELSSQGVVDIDSAEIYLQQFSKDLLPGQTAEIAMKAEVQLYELLSSYDSSSKSVSLKLDSIVIRRTMIDIIIYMAIILVAIIYEIAKFAIYK